MNILFEDIQNITKKYIEELKNNRVKTLFFNSNCDGFIKRIEFESDDVEMAYFSSTENSGEPYYPLLEMVKNTVEKNKIDRFLNEKNIYASHFSIFSNYFENGNTIREEELLKEEYSFERELFIDEIIRMVLTVNGEKNKIYLIDNIERLSYSVLKIIERIVTHVEEGRVMFVFSYNRNNTNFVSEKEEIWRKLLEIVELKSFSVKVDIMHSLEKMKKKSSQEMIESKVQRAENFFNFLDFDECNSILDLVEKEHFTDKIDKNNPYFEKVIIMKGDIARFKDNNDLAATYYNKYLQFALTNGKNEKIADAYRLISAVYCEKFDFEEALKTSFLSLNFLDNIDNRLLRCKINLIKFLALDQLRYVYYELFKKSYFEICNELLEFKMYNAYSKIIGVSVVDNIVFENIEDRLKMCNKAIKIAEKQGNYFKLASLYHNKGMIYSSVNNNRESFKFYKKSERLKTKLGNKREIVRIYNGMGYGYFLAEMYKNSMNCFNKALQFLMESKDYDEMGLTLFNMGQLCFFATKYKLAIDYFEKTISFVNILKIKEIAFHSLCGVYSFLTICYYKENNMIKFHESFSKAKNYRKFLKTDEEIFFMIAELIFDDSDSIRIEEEFNRIEKLIYKNKLLYLLPILYFEIAMIYKNREEKDKYMEKLSFGEKATEAIGFAFWNSIFVSEKTGNSNFVKSHNFKTKNIDMQYMLEYAEQRIVSAKLQKRVNEISFLNNMQKIFMSKDILFKEMIYDYVALIKNHFYFDRCYVFKKEKGKWFLSYPENDNLKEYSEYLEKYSSEKREIIINKNDLIIEKLPFKYNSMIFIPMVVNDVVEGAVLFISEKAEVTFNEEELHILAISVRQFAISLANKKLQEELLKKEKLETMINLSNAIVHEVKTPLVGIIGFAGIVKKKYSEDGIIKKYMEMITKEAGRVDEMSTQLLEYAGQNEHRYKFERVKIETIISDVINSLSKEIEDNRIEIKIDLDSVEEIEADKNQMEKGIFMILKNSIEASKGSNDFIKISVRNIEEIIRIEIEDNGVGIKKELLSRIFEPLVTTKIQGTGLGLPIVKHIINSHGGNIEIESNGEFGVKVFIEIPKNQN